MSFFKKSFETITQNLAKMAEDLMEHAELQRERGYKKRALAIDMQRQADEHAAEAKKAHETSQRLQTLIGG